MSSEFDHYINLLGNPDNPVFLSILFIILFVFIIYIIYLKFFIPAKKKHLNEKRDLELDNLRIIGAFSESDPNPIVRTDTKGDIIHFNRSAQKLFQLQKGGKINLKQISPELNFNYEKEIGNSSNIQLDLTVGDKNYSVYFYGIKTLQMARVYFIDHTERIIYQKQLVESEQKYRSLSFYLQDHMEEEKDRIGLELHDSIGQNLYLVKLKINNSVDNDTFKKNVMEINEALDSTISELREILFNLKPKVLEDMGLLEAVRTLSEKISANFKIKGEVDYAGTPIRLNKKTELYLFRIIQESLSNILRHSRATGYFIQFVFSPSTLKIHIADNGIGFNTNEISQFKQYGMLNMSERIKTLNGKMKLNSSDEDGTSLYFEIPCGVI
ncbi:MAG: sensor histidine kinase [Ignavibacteriaceae bacterium]|nr:sensor histidine kinase [Ignavibacteriaceae bacterium]